MIWKNVARIRSRACFDRALVEDAEHQSIWRSRDDFIAFFADDYSPAEIEIAWLKYRQHWRRKGWILK